MGVLDRPLGILLLYSHSHSHIQFHSHSDSQHYLKRGSSLSTGGLHLCGKDANTIAKSDREINRRVNSKSIQNKRMGKMKNKEEMEKLKTSDFISILPFCYIDIKWLLQFEERNATATVPDLKGTGTGTGAGAGISVNRSVKNVPNRETLAERGKKRMKREEVVDRISFLADTMVIVTKTNLTVTKIISTEKIRSVNIEIDDNRMSQRGLNETKLNSKSDTGTFRSVIIEDNEVQSRSAHSGADYKGSGRLFEKNPSVNESVKSLFDEEKRKEEDEKKRKEEREVEEEEEFKVLGGTIFTCHLRG